VAVLCTLEMPEMVEADSTVIAEENDQELLVRTVRGAKDRGAGSSSNSCRYTKGQWSECDPKTNKRTRTLSLKKGDKSCEQTKIIDKKCKKACRYEKGPWSSCVNGQLTRVDTLKANSDATSCEKSRRMTKRCKPETNTKKTAKAERSNKKGGKQ